MCRTKLLVSGQFEQLNTGFGMMEPISFKLLRPNESVPRYHNSINQWNKRIQNNFRQQNHAANCQYINGTRTFKRTSCFKGQKETIKAEKSTDLSNGNYFQKGQNMDVDLRKHKTNESLIIEWDCIDSFHEFAIYMDKSNPICPAEQLDTPEKLMNLLVFNK